MASERYEVTRHSVLPPSMAGSHTADTIAKTDRAISEAARMTDIKRAQVQPFSSFTGWIVVALLTGLVELIFLQSLFWNKARSRKV